MDKEYSFVRFQSEHSALLRELYLKVNKQNWSEKDFTEKFSTSGIGGEVIGFLAFSSDGDIAAYYGVFPVRVHLNGVVSIAAQSGNTMTSPEHQGKGLFTILARMTYEAARDEGIAFVFGFPNKNSYPGFIKKLNWKHSLTMHAYNFYVPTLPVSEILNRFSKDCSKYRSYQNFVLDLFSKKLGPRAVIKTSLSDDAWGGVVRDSNYSFYKKRDLHVINVHDCEIFFKVSRSIDIGDIYFTSSDSLKLALRKLKWIACVLGVVRIRFYLTPGCATDDALRELKAPSDGLPYGHLAIKKECDPDRYAFSFIDYDTF